MSVNRPIWNNSYEEKALLNKCDLSARLKAGQLSILRRAVGRLFRDTMETVHLNSKSNADPNTNSLFVY